MRIFSKMIFWLVLKFEISYRVIIYYKILVSCRGFFEDYIFAWWSNWVFIILLLPQDTFECKWQGNNVTHLLLILSFIFNHFQCKLAPSRTHTHTHTHSHIHKSFNFNILCFTLWNWSQWIPLRHVNYHLPLWYYKFSRIFYIENTFDVGLSF
jgi:hypothetical protein